MSENLAIGRSYPMEGGSIGMRFKGKRVGAPDMSRRLMPKRIPAASGRKFTMKKGAW
ncbi:hypothetical protein Q2T83_11520 [Fervidibacter sacchari]|uniref:Uncharacterized protein n=1 Tax=Candidatus Fervidibacter sacchari TaxID=1448929 RepID=A0ABT2ESV2_9BACT|nr:hypothetical protein [Candidatus Fervidibacter sacchari]MCS3921021.1 hypothetical protein [Candidatus Fervidibacter sacchari]WKU14963.1 hypothetical protein Q2T83_11520 [Candidatus Fervidibacter sacchari]